MGRHAVREALLYRPELVERLYLAESEQGAAKELLAVAEAAGVRPELCTPAVLRNLCASDSHQGAVVLLRPQQEPDFKAFILHAEKLSQGLIIALDGVSDPHNVGAVLRASEVFGATAVLWAKTRGPGLSAVLGKSSSGASLLLPHFIVPNLAESARKLSSAGFWLVSAEVGPDAQSLQQFSFPEKTVLLLGSEGAGVSRLLSEISEFKVKIPQFGKIDSLNVSQAAAIFCYAYRMQISLKTA
jgi:23S rRNA (guanosine2251-2'-O)-methyltransferase